jgi:hypothetical protein
MSQSHSTKPEKNRPPTIPARDHPFNEADCDRAMRRLNAWNRQREYQQWRPSRPRGKRGQ